MVVCDLCYKTITITDPETGETRKAKAKTNRHGIGGRWQVPYVDLDGNRTSAVFHLHEEAALFDAKVKVNKADGTLISADKKDVTLEEIWPAWLDSKANVSEKSRKRLHLLLELPHPTCVGSSSNL